jgi:membrane-associated phospholipid phosphatase
MFNLLLLLILILSLYIYFPLNARPSRYYWQTQIDRYILLSPIWIYGYILYYPFSIFGYLVLIFSSQAIPFFVANMIATFSGYLFWWIFPNGTRRPPLPTHLSTLSLHITRYIYNKDGDTNACPSAHVYHAMIVTWYLTLIFPSHTLLFLIICTIICISTLTTKQHYFVDVPAGMALATLSIYLTSMFF